MHLVVRGLAQAARRFYTGLAMVIETRGRRRRGKYSGPYRPGQMLRLTLGQMTNRGHCLAHTADGIAVFVAYGLPGEEVVAEVERAYREHLEAHVVEVIQSAPERIEPRCPYFGSCGGCNFQHIPYERQLELKREVVVETLRRIGRFEDVPVPAAIASPRPWEYRNQARFSTNREGTIGFTRRGSHRVERIDLCHIVEPAIRELIPRLQGRGAGLHQIVVRTGVNTGDLLINPDLSGRGVTIPTGQDWMSERVEGQPFDISASAFFQVNTRQAENMVRLVRERLQLGAEDVLADLYAGVGFFSKLLAPNCRAVVAIEVSKAAAENARRNLAGVANVAYQLGDVEKVLPFLVQRPNKVLLDPSREGCTPAAVDAILAIEPQRIVYISCDAATLARDLRRMVDGGYTLHEVQPLDMFPQTFHIECIATLTQRPDGERGFFAVDTGSAPSA